MTFTHSILKFMLLFGVKYNIRIHFWIVFSIDLLAYLSNNKLERDRIQIDKILKNRFRFNNFLSVYDSPSYLKMRIFDCID